MSSYMYDVLPGWGKMDLVEEIRKSWSWVGFDPEEVVCENDFGNLIIRDRHGWYWRLCPEDIYCEIVARSREELDALFQDQEFVTDWSMQGLVDQAKEALGPLPVGRKYHLVIPGALGGEYSLSNIKTAPLLEIIGLSGDIGQQIQDLPDGAQIRLKVTE